MVQNNIRAFIAIELNTDIRLEINKIQDILKKAGAHVKWVHNKNLHLTLAFLGDVPDCSVGELCRSIKQTTGGFLPFDLELGGYGYFPESGRPNVLWIGVTSGRETIEKIEKALHVHVKNFTQKERQKNFSAHITLGRIRSDKNIDKLISALNDPDLIFLKKQKVENITLFQSQLTPSGPEYKEISKFKLM